jgi:hypothetical protein
MGPVKAVCRTWTALVPRVTWRGIATVSTTSLSVAVGGEVNVALLIDAAYEVFRFLRGARVDVAQQALQREGAHSD